MSNYSIIDLREEGYYEVTHRQFLEIAASGCISGRLSEWPQWRPAVQWAIQYIDALQEEIDRLNQEVDELSNKIYGTNKSDMED